MWIKLCATFFHSVVNSSEVDQQTLRDLEEQKGIVEWAEYILADYEQSESNGDYVDPNVLEAQRNECWDERIILNRMQRMYINPLAEYDLKQLTVPNDGACLYHALTGSFLALDESWERISEDELKWYSTRVRNMILDIAEARQEKFAYNIQFSGFDFKKMAYPDGVEHELRAALKPAQMDQLRNPTLDIETWGQDWMAIIFGQKLGVDVGIYQIEMKTIAETANYKEGDIKPTPWFHYNLEDSKTLRHEVDTDQIHEFQPNSIYIFHKIAHYNATLQTGKQEGLKQLRKLEDVLKKHEASMKY